MVVAEVEYLLRSVDASWCYERWERLPNDGNRYEVIDGVLYMSTAPSARHQATVALFIELIGASLRAQGIARVFPSPIGVMMPGADPVQPDLVLVRHERAAIIAEDGRIRGVPDLIAEILSPNNPELDTVTKRATYARAGVPEYWILRPATRDILVCTRPDADLSDFTDVHLFTQGDELISLTLPIRVPVAALFDDTLPGDN
jgi:Uma2 family endonuclease